MTALQVPVERRTPYTAVLSTYTRVSSDLSLRSTLAITFVGPTAMTRSNTVLYLRFG